MFAHTYVSMHTRAHMVKKLCSHCMGGAVHGAITVVFLGGSLVTRLTVKTTLFLFSLFPESLGTDEAKRSECRWIKIASYLQYSTPFQ